MKPFTFQNSVLTLDIEGRIFDIRADAAFAKKLRILSAEAEIRSKTSGGMTPSAFMAHVIDELLGAGACTAIFGSTRPDLYDAADVIAYICDAYTAHLRERMARYAAGEEGQPV